MDPRLEARLPTARPCEEVGPVGGGGGRGPEPHLVGEDHEPIVCLAPDGTAHTLGCMAHGVEGEKVILADLELVPQVL